MPLTFPQGGAPLTASSLERTLAPQASLIIDSEALASVPVLTGSLQLSADGQISGFAVFRYQPNGQEAVVPLEDRSAPSYILAFDNTTGLANGVAVSNAAASNAAIPVIIRDEAGAQLSNSELNVAGNGHTAFVLASQYPVTAGLRGTIEFLAPPGGKISAVGIRFTIPKLAFTSLPALTR